MLSRRDHRYLRGLRWQRRAAIPVGLLLALAGGLYAIWGASQFRSGLDAETRPGQWASSRDPIARVGLLFAPYRERLREAEPETDAERLLLRELDQQTALSSQLLVLLARFMVASFALTSGLLLLSNALATRRLLAILDSIPERPPTYDPSERDPGSRTSGEVPASGPRS